MVDAAAYMDRLTGMLRAQFGERLCYVGLQGSYARGEADGQSDLDCVVVLDVLMVADLARYRKILAQMGDAVPTCGFLCGRVELANWNPFELWQLAHETTDWYGALAPLLPAYTREDVWQHVQLGLDNLYHALCHSYLHTPDCGRGSLPEWYKAVFYLLQNWTFVRTGRFVPTKAALLACLTGQDHAVLEMACRIRAGEAYDPEQAYALLFAWCQDGVQRI